MYAVSNDVKTALRNGIYQEIRIFCADYPQEDDAPLITNTNIVQGSFHVSDTSVSGSDVEVGSTMSKELSFQLFNTDGEFDDYDFLGCDLEVEVVVTINNVETSIPIGFFTVDSAPTGWDILSITALDAMTKFDKAVDINANCSIATLVSRCCSSAGVTLGSVLTGLPNSSVTVPSFEVYQDPVGEDEEAPEPTYITDGMTLRNLLQCCFALMGVDGWIDRNGVLVCGWYGSSVADTIGATDRFSTEVSREDTVITGITYNDTLYGTDSYAIDFSSNALLEVFNDTNKLAMITEVKDNIIGMRYRIASADCMGLPYLDCHDKVTLNGTDGGNVTTYITSHNWTLNGNSSISAQGSTQNAKLFRGTGMTQKANLDAIVTASKVERLKTAVEVVNDLADEARQSASDAYDYALSAGESASIAQMAAEATIEANYRKYNYIVAPNQAWIDTHCEHGHSESWARSNAEGYYQGACAVGDVLLIYIKFNNKVHKLLCRVTRASSAGSATTAEVISYSSNIHAYFWHDEDGCHIKNEDGYRTDLGGNGMEIYKGGAKVASFDDDSIELGANSISSEIAFCGGVCEIVGYNVNAMQGISMQNSGTMSNSVKEKNIVVSAGDADYRTGGFSALTVDGNRSNSGQGTASLYANHNASNGIGISMTSDSNGSIMSAYCLSNGSSTNVLVIGTDKNVYVNNESSNTGWTALNLTASNKFVAYNTEQTPKYCKRFGVVTLTGGVLPKAAITGSTTEVTIGTLPTGYRPTMNIYQVCQGSGTDSWLLHIDTAGVVSFSRYHAANSTSYKQATTSTWLPFHVTFCI